MCVDEMNIKYLWNHRNDRIAIKICIPAIKLQEKKQKKKRNTRTRKIIGCDNKIEFTFSEKILVQFTKRILSQNI